MAKHTPGPWKSAIWDKRINIYDGQNRVTPFAWVDNDDVDPREASANARLICAAPDLLESVAALLPIVESLDDGDGDGLPSCVVAARAALKRAGWKAVSK